MLSADCACHVVLAAMLRVRRGFCADLGAGPQTVRIDLQPAERAMRLDPGFGLSAHGLILRPHRQQLFQHSDFTQLIGTGSPQCLRVGCRRGCPLLLPRGQCGAGVAAIGLRRSRHLLLDLLQLCLGCLSHADGAAGLGTAKVSAQRNAQAQTQRVFIAARFAQGIQTDHWIAASAGACMIGARPGIVELGARQTDLVAVLANIALQLTDLRVGRLRLRDHHGGINRHPREFGGEQQGVRVSFALCLHLLRLRLGQGHVHSIQIQRRGVAEAQALAGGDLLQFQAFCRQGQTARLNTAEQGIEPALVQGQRDLMAGVGQGLDSALLQGHGRTAIRPGLGWQPQAATDSVFPFGKSACASNIALLQAGVDRELVRSLSQGLGIETAGIAYGLGLCHSGMGIDCCQGFGRRWQMAAGGRNGSTQQQRGKASPQDAVHTRLPNSSTGSIHQCTCAAGVAFRSSCNNVWMRSPGKTMNSTQRSTRPRTRSRTLATEKSAP